MTNSIPPSTTSEKPYITCREVFDSLMAYLDSELTPEQRQEFERHLAVCPSCVNYLNSYIATVKLGKAAMQTPTSPAETSLENVPAELVRAIHAARLKGG